MIKTHRSFLMMSLLLGSQVAAGVASLRAGDMTLANTADYKGAALDNGNFEKSKLVFTADARVGYDDNTLATPDSVTVIAVNSNHQVVSVTRDQNSSGSAFVNFDVGAGYTTATPRATLSLGGDVGVNYYFDRPGRSYDVNGAINGSFSYKLTPQAVLNVTSYNAYTSEPDFGASNLTNFGGSSINNANNLNGVTAADRQNGDFFYTADRIELAYQWAPRFSTVTGYNLTAFAYKEDPYSTDEDRIENYFSQQLRYLVSPLVTAVAEYRFGYIDYFSVNNDSYENFALLGADFTISKRLQATVRAGAQFRDDVSYDNGTNVSPYVEASLNYNLTSLATVNFLARYSDEEGDVTSGDTDSNTLRLGISYQQQIGRRLSAYLSFYYTNSQYYGADTLLFDPFRNQTYVGGNGKTVVVVPGNFAENTFDVATGLRYALNKIISAEVGYTHTSVLSDIDSRQYDRNRYFGGIRFSF